MSQYVPLSARDGDDSRDYQALTEGVPPWLKPHLLKWVNDLLRASRGGWNDRAIKTIELDLKLAVNAQGDILMQQCAASDWVLINVVNWLLEVASISRESTSDLSSMLDRGGSVWRVESAANGTRLVRRVLPALVDLADHVRSVGDVAAEHLGRGWREAWGVGGNADEAYSQAVKAVEAVLQPAVSPANATATLGTMIREIEQAPHKFQVRLEPRRGANAVDAFVQQLKLLWQSQPRHGEADTVAQVTEDQARDAVTLAIQIADWIQRGAFVPREVASRQGGAPR